MRPYREHVQHVRRFGVLALMLVVLLYAIQSAYAPAQLARLKLQKTELQRLTDQNAELMERTTRLAAVLNAMATDPELVVYLARRDIGMVRDGEIVYEFRSPAPPPGAKTPRGGEDGADPRP